MDSVPERQCGTSVLVTSTRLGSSNFSASRFAAVMTMLTMLPSGIVTPEISISVCVIRVDRQLCSLPDTRLGLCGNWGIEMDRRVRRTRELLWRSLVGLILERGYDKVSVQDILDRADIGRSTFYAHYQTKTIC